MRLSLRTYGIRQCQGTNNTTIRKTDKESEANETDQTFVEVTVSESETSDSKQESTRERSDGEENDYTGILQKKKELLFRASL